MAFMQNSMRNRLTYDGRTRTVNRFKVVLPSLPENPVAAAACIPTEEDQVDSTSSLNIPSNIDDNEAVSSVTYNLKVGTNSTLETQDHQVSSSSMLPDTTENEQVIYARQIQTNSVGFAPAVNSKARAQLRILPETSTGYTQTDEDGFSVIEVATVATETENIIQNETSSQHLRDCSMVIYSVTNYTEEDFHSCEVCNLLRKPKYTLTIESNTMYICGDFCLSTFKGTKGCEISVAQDAGATSGFRQVQFFRKCFHCNEVISNEANPLVLSWETFEFCNDVCLAAYQKQNCSTCAKCKMNVEENCLGKFCVRFGQSIKQFCSNLCLENYKKDLKICSYCQKEMFCEGFLAYVTAQNNFKEFCTRECLNNYRVLTNDPKAQPLVGRCSICLKDKVTIAYSYSNKQHKFCSDPCFMAFRFVKNVSASKCDVCQKYFDSMLILDFGIHYEEAMHIFCSKACQNIYVATSKKIESCMWCKVNKFSFDMIKRKDDSGILSTCSLNCLNQQLLSMARNSAFWTVCDQCRMSMQPLFHLKMSDASTRNFCSYPCVLEFQNGFLKEDVQLVNAPVPVSRPRRYIPITARVDKPVTPTIPIITHVESLASVNEPPPSNRRRLKQKAMTPPQTIVKTQVRHQVVVKPPCPVVQRNVSTMCRVTMISKATSCKVIKTADKSFQTDEIKKRMNLIPVPVPAYVPLPMRMYAQPFPVPFPFPLPVPVPIFIPTLRNSAKGIMKEIQKIKAKMPSNPLEAELLVMADMIAGDQKVDTTDSEAEGDDPTEAVEDQASIPEQCTGNTSVGEDALQMAVKLASELDQPTVDLEGALAVNTVTVSDKPDTPVAAAQTRPSHLGRQPSAVQRSIRGRGARGLRGRRRTRHSFTLADAIIMSVPEQPEALEKPDANMCLKYTFGVNAWKQWVVTKNAELEQSSSRVKLFKTEILQLTSDELNYSLCLFVREVRKPNGQEYAPDTIYYLCLGIQQYLYENNRIDNIFCDAYYEKFTDCLDDVVKKFSVLFNESNYIITRVEEEHLWESKQLGAQSPHVLLSTLMFFNTKHFNLTTVEDHLQLSFSHIMKHWRRHAGNSGSQKFAGNRNVLLRFYPPQTAEGNTTRRKKVYEQHENAGNPFRCPVKLYEFYLSKCPESVKTRNDVFYLQPERSCVPESPVWYSTSALPQKSLEKMLHRVKMVKEVNIALLTT